MKHVLTAAATLCALAFASIAAQPLAPRPNGMDPAPPTRHMLVGATIHTAPGETLDADDNPAILIEDGEIVGVLRSADTARLEPGYQIHELTPEHHIYAGFIEPWFAVDAPAPDTGAPGAHWNTRITPQRDALAGDALKADDAESLRAMGFTAAMIAPRGGIIRGRTAIVSTAAPFDDPSMGQPPVHRAGAAQALGFDRTTWRDASYPTSHMGVMALLRQTFSDAEDRRRGDHDDASCLDHLDPDASPLIYDTDHELEALLADKVAREFDHDEVVLVGAGSEHRRLGAFVEMGHPLIVPLRYPEDLEVASVDDADAVSLSKLQHLERAPANARWLAGAGLDVALTASKLRDGQDFWTNLRRAIETGLDPAAALAMLTTVPAEILDLDAMGTIERGSIANLVVSRGDMFDDDADARIIDVWVDGRRHAIHDDDEGAFDGRWTLGIIGSDDAMTLEIDGDTINTTGPGDGTEIDPPATGKAAKVEMSADSISFVIHDKDDGSGRYVMSGVRTAPNQIRGTGLAPDQSAFEWTAVRTGAALSLKDFAGTWDAVLSERFELSFKIKGKAVTVIERIDDDDDITQKAEKVRIEDDALRFAFEHEPFGMEGTFTIALRAPEGDALEGSGARADGERFNLTAQRASDDRADADTLPDAPPSPFGPYAYDEPPAQESVLIHNATIWTQTDAGVIDTGWIRIDNGEIRDLGAGEPRTMRADRVIDAQGRHVTPGLIDAHSHTGLFRFGVNEAGQAVTSECRIADSLDPGHIGFYRELAGGLTTAMLLHGSANPIGGQSQTIKLRWNSARPEDMHFEDAKPGIKFALGENVKQSNWGDDKTTRYPQSRLGVETIFRDRFTRAREYADRGMETRDGRRDLELEALAEILAGDRMVHCHSYRQDEILMLCRIAEDFGFTIGTFQHGLETYKVAEVVREHAIGASLFSDWWAYKVEVQDAIPFAGPINHEAGLLTSYNSDSDDLARRMHVEAGKALKYARMSGINMSEQDALAFVTNNPAIQLGIDDRVGSLARGMDADLVVWSGHPLSSLTRAERTFVDGREYFSLERDARMQSRIRDQRQRLIQKLLDDGGGAEPETDPKPDPFVEPTRARGLARFTSDTPYNHDTPGSCGCDDLFPHWREGY